MFKFLARRWEKKRQREAAYQAAEVASASMFAAADNYLSQAAKNMLAVLSERFTTIYDQPEHDPRLIARIEWDIFKEQLQAYPAKMRQGLQEDVPEWFDLASEIGLKEQLDQYIGERIRGSVVGLYRASFVMRGEAIAGVDKPREPLNAASAQSVCPPDLP